ncbi:hypothetical protein BOTBODRAFT_109192 [Botryobasidium botryosum FD-172 SS1]|uniref:Histone deacetylase domain-containing protein n=1 Tax=Botryobasidium botryosum (strain FD-172 SS1) TaxID=930990 RepID=A0A067MHV1_BOTB1|nr:hypothetical protein BOTBODRAFT_109192 [Botryobasidium botryosum FD-172 SS1]
MEPSRTAVFLQPAGLQHRYIRKKHALSDIVERPERLRAVCVGVAAAIARLDAREVRRDNKTTLSGAEGSTVAPLKQGTIADDLVNALDRLHLQAAASGAPAQAQAPQESVVRLVQSRATLDIYTHPAVQFVHGEDPTLPTSKGYLRDLGSWCATSQEKINEGGSEIPPGYPQGDLYRTIDAIASAAATVCEAVDMVTNENDTSPRRAFVAIRPPGHHCSDDVPSGFCFINNVVVAAAHAHLQHNINAVIILDIDLHHGNGTQALAWSINADTDRKDLEEDARAAAGSSLGQPESAKRGLKIYFGSLHDINSFPCEDGDAELVQAASTSLHNAHGQFIENVHIEPYESEEDFYARFYDKYKARLLGKAKAFLDAVKATPKGTIVLVSAGFDASQHEHSSMSRHSRFLPTSFYTRFARDAAAFADQHAEGKLVSVLEGGYSDRALMSGAGAWVQGLADAGLASTNTTEEDGQWWDAKDLAKVKYHHLP